jgi:hypothetical protein
MGFPVDFFHSDRIQDFAFGGSLKLIARKS